MHPHLGGSVFKNVLKRVFIKPVIIYFMSMRVESVFLT